MTAASASSTAGRASAIAPLIVGAAAFVQAFDSSAISVALPMMARAFGVPAISLGLVITAYLVGATAFLPLCGWAADRFGARRVFLTAVIGFGLASLACALATSLPWLILARAMEGCMGALLLPVGRVIVLRSVPRDQTVAAISLLTVPLMLGPLLGPLLGGLILTAGSWRYLFLCNVVLAICGTFAVRRYISDVPAAHPRPLDVTGFLLIGGALVGTTLGVGAMARGHANSYYGGGLIAAGIGCALLYWRHCLRVAHPVLDLRILRIMAVHISNVGGLFPRLLISATSFLFALLFQIGFGLTPAAAGGIIFANAAGAAMGRWGLTGLLARIGFRRLLIGNAWAIAITVAACAAFSQTTPIPLILCVLFLQGLLRSVQLIALVTLGYAGVAEKDMGSASTIASVSQQFALSLGITLSVLTLQITQGFAGEPRLTTDAIAPAFLVLAGVSLLSLFWFVRLAPDAGEELIRRTPSPQAQTLESET